VVYEESCPYEHLLDFMTIYHFKCCFSPLHDHDKWTAEDVKNYKSSVKKMYGINITDDMTEWQRPTGEMRKNEYGGAVPETMPVLVPYEGMEKKPHRHVLTIHDYSILASTALNLFSPLDIAWLEVVNSRDAYIRYLCHLDNPEKYRYDVGYVVGLGGMKLDPLYMSDSKQDYETNKFIYNAIHTYHFKSLTKLVEYCRNENQDFAVKDIKSHHFYWVSYMKDLHFQYKVRAAKEKRTVVELANGVCVLVDGNGDVIEDGTDE
jgi:hypothetical protein